MHEDEPSQVGAQPEFRAHPFSRISFLAMNMYDVNFQPAKYVAPRASHKPVSVESLILIKIFPILHPFFKTVLTKLF